ncbi:hypothetical protein [Argonema antarcticum]|nr:hypothetical protein [Argonema antarcticum]
MTETAVIIPKADIEALEGAYTFRGREEILQFIAKYPFLVPVLLEAPDKVKHYFPDSRYAIRGAEQNVYHFGIPA